MIRLDHCLNVHPVSTLCYHVIDDFTRVWVQVEQVSGVLSGLRRDAGQGQPHGPARRSRQGGLRHLHQEKKQGESISAYL